MSGPEEWGEPEPFGEDESGEPVLWNCPNPDCSAQKDTKEKAAAHCADTDETGDIDAGGSAESDGTPRVDAGNPPAQNGHYQQDGIEDTAHALGRLTVDGLPAAQCLGVHDHFGWYQDRPETDPETIRGGFDGRGSVYALADDYGELAANIERTLYATTNYQHLDERDWRLFATDENGSKEWKDDDAPLPEYGDILGFSILADVDLEDEYKERPLPAGTRETVEQAIGEYADAFGELVGDRERVYALDSVGGAYLLTPPAATAPIARAFDGDDRKRVFESLRERADEWLDDVREDVNETVPGTEGVFDADLLNQVNRQYKAPLSIHSSIDGVVHPLSIDTEDGTPAYEFVSVADVTESVVDETVAWAAEFTHSRHTDAVGHVVAALWPEYTDEYDGWQDALEAWVADEREAEKEQRRKAQQAAEERAQRAAERDDDLPAFTDAVADTADLGIATTFDDVQAAVDRVDAQQVVRRLCDEYDTDAGRDPPRFEPSYRNSESGTSCFVDSEKITDLDDTHAAIGVLDYVAREQRYIGETDTATDEARGKARDDLRNMGFEVPVYTPVEGSRSYDGEEFEEMPGWARAKAAVALGVCDPDDVEDGWKLSPTHHDALLRILEQQGIEHGREPFDPEQRDHISSGNAAVSDGGTAAGDESDADDAPTDTDTDDGDSTGENGDEEPDLWADVRRLYADDEKEDSKIAMNYAVDQLGDEIDVATHDESEALYSYDPADGIYHERGHHRVQEYLSTSDALGRTFYPARARNIIETLKYKTYTPEREFGAPRNRICVANGVLDVSDPSDPTLTDHSPDHLFTDGHPVEYNPDADCPEFMDFLDDSVRDEDRKKLQEYAGYVLHTWSQRYKKSLMLVGPQDSGKGTFLRILTAVIGEDNISSETLENLVESRWAAAQLYEGVANIRNEMSTTKLKHTERFKEMTGGGDRMSAEKKNQPKFRFTVTQKFLFATNEVPEVNSDDPFNNRWLFASFPHTVPTSEIDPDLADRITGEKPEYDGELSGVLNWMLEGYARLREQGRFSGERTIEEKEEMWEKYGNTVDRFKHACLEVTGDNDDLVRKDDVMPLYKAFCARIGKDPELKQTVTKELASDADIEHGDRTIPGDSAQSDCYIGVTVESGAFDNLDVVPFGPDDESEDGTQNDQTTFGS